MKAWVLMLVVASCGTSTSSSEETPLQGGSEAVAETLEPSAVEATEEVVEAEALEAPAPIVEGPSNFVTPHHCHPPGPCTFEFETLRGPQHIDVGHGHAAPPRLGVVLRVDNGEARVESLTANEEGERRGEVVARPRDSLEGGAFYLTLDGEASAVDVELRFVSTG